MHARMYKDNFQFKQAGYICRYFNEAFHLFQAISEHYVAAASLLLALFISFICIHVFEPNNTNNNNNCEHLSCFDVLLQPTELVLRLRQKLLQHGCILGVPPQCQLSFAQFHALLQLMAVRQDVFKRHCNRLQCKSCAL